MKKTELIFNLISIPVDIAALAAAGTVSFYLRFQFTQYVGPVLFDLNFVDLAGALAKIVPLLLLIFAFLGLYNLRGTRRFVHEFNRILVGTSLVMLLGVVLFFFNQSIFPSRFIILSAWVLSVIFILLGRFILKQVQEASFARGYGLHKLVLVNGHGMESKIIQKALRDRSHGYEIVGELSNGPALLGQLEQLAQQFHLDEIMQADPSTPASENLQLVEFARRKGIHFSFVPNLFEVRQNSVEINNLTGVPIISLKNSPLDGWGKVLKRILDIIVSTFCLVITSPFFLILAILIKADSPGRVIYAAERCGKRETFWFYKFRSMYAHLSVGENFGNKGAEDYLKTLINSNDANRSGPLYKIKNDPRVTPIGRFLRRSKLDEIPQFWNVLKGDMSMVGPRPHLPDQVERYRDRYGRMFSVKPGIFGLTQIAQISFPALPFEEEVRLDTYYIENWSLWLDITILAKSFYMLVANEGSKEDY